MIKRFLPFIFAGILGIAAVALMQQYLGQQRKALQAERAKLMEDFAGRVEILVARVDIPEGTTITPDHLGVFTIPQKFVQPYATSRPSDLIGQVALAPIAEREQLLQNKVRPASEAPRGKTLSRITLPGKRAVTMQMDEIKGVGGFVRPGDSVDILWSFQAPLVQGGPPELVTITLFQDVDVLAVGAQLVGTPVSERHEGADYIITVSLEPEETEVLMYARARGNVELSLRSRGETVKQVPLPPASMALIMENILGQGAPDPVAQPHMVEVFKGLERTVVSVGE